MTHPGQLTPRTGPPPRGRQAVQIAGAEGGAAAPTGCQPVTLTLPPLETQRQAPARQNSHSISVSPAPPPPRQYCYLFRVSAGLSGAAPDLRLLLQGHQWVERAPENTGPWRGQRPTQWGRELLLRVTPTPHQLPQPVLLLSSLSRHQQVPGRPPPQSLRGHHSWEGGPCHSRPHHIHCLGPRGPQPTAGHRWAPGDSTTLLLPASSRRCLLGPAALRVEATGAQEPDACGAPGPQAICPHLVQGPSLGSQGPPQAPGPFLLPPRALLRQAPRPAWTEGQGAPAGGPSGSKATRAAPRVGVSPRVALPHCSKDWPRPTSQPHVPLCPSLSAAEPWGQTVQG